LDSLSKLSKRLYNFEKSAGHRDCRVNVLYRVELLLLRVQMQKEAKPQ
jgi:hypothetical protein